MTVKTVLISVRNFHTFVTNELLTPIQIYRPLAHVFPFILYNIWGFVLPVATCQSSVRYRKAAFLKLWSADHKWSSGYALVVLLD